MASPYSTEVKTELNVAQEMERAQIFQARSKPSLSKVDPGLCYGLLFCLFML
jgi:hypothetical protein